MATTFANHVLEGDHASRPAFGDVPQGTLYACSDHSLIYQSDGSTAWSTWATLGGDVSSHLADATDAHDASAISVLDTAANFTGTDVEAVLAELQDNIDGVSGGGSVQQIYAYPQHADLTGDSDHFTSDNTSKWVNSSPAFDTRQVLGGSFQHLQILGASQTSSITQTLGTTKAGAFDVRTLVYQDANYHAGNDVVFKFVGLTAADAQIFAFIATAVSGMHQNLTVEHTGALTETAVPVPFGAGITMRVTRDGSNAVRFEYGVGPTPGALSKIYDGNLVPIAATSSGTLAKIAYALVVPSGPSASAERNIYIDYFQVA